MLDLKDIPYIYIYIPQGRIRVWGAHPVSASPKIGKNMIFWRKIVIFHTKYPKKKLRLPPQLEKIWFVCVKSWFFTRNTPKSFVSPSQLEKIWIFGVKSWFFTRNLPKFFLPPSARRNFFKCIPPNLKSWIRPCTMYILLKAGTWHRF